MRPHRPLISLLGLQRESWPPLAEETVWPQKARWKTSEIKGLPIVAPESAVFARGDMLGMEK